MPKVFFYNEVIAVYYCKQNGQQLQFRRDGRAYWKYADGTWKLATGKTNFELIEQWLKEVVEKEGHEYERVDLGMVVEEDELEGNCEV